MTDRIPTQILENGAIRYAEYDSSGNFVQYRYLLPADEPTQVGTPINKANLLSDTTAALYGLGNEGVPDNAFRALAALVPSDKGLLLISVKTSTGGAGASIVNISPSVGSKKTNERGLLSLTVNPGVYTVSVPASPFSNGASTQVTLEAGKSVFAELVYEVSTSGQAEITTSQSIAVPSDIVSLDLFAVGGGGSGGCAITSSGTYYVGGGAGGRTATLLNYNAAGKIIDVNIGAGGTAVTSTGNGNDGGNTSVSIDANTILTAPGGAGGTYGTSSGKGGNGGCGGGGANSTTAGNGGSDGAAGTDSNGGTGQGTTTRAFGEPGGALYSGGGGGIKLYPSVVGLGGPGGGGSGSMEAGTAQNATNYGGGGGGLYIDSSSPGASGAGYQGLVIIRWGN